VKSNGAVFLVGAGPGLTFGPAAGSGLPALPGVVAAFGRKPHDLDCGALPRRRYALNFAMDKPPGRI
jgi:hypothetical protein